MLFRNSRKAKRVWFCPWYALDLITLYTALSDRDRTLEQLLYAIEHDNRAGFWTDIAKINAFRIQLLDGQICTGSNEPEGVVNVRFGSLAASLVNISLMSAFERIADVRISLVLATACSRQCSFATVEKQKEYGSAPGMPWT